jgi:hypothetical protein
VATDGEDRGFGAVLALTFGCMLLTVVQPLLLITIPLALLLMGMPWRRPVLVVAGAALLVASVIRGRGEPLADLERGWALLLGAWFVVAVVVLPGRHFLVRGLVALGAAALSLAGLLWLNSGSPTNIDDVIAEQLRTGAAQAASSWQFPRGWDQLGMELTSAVNRAAELQALIYPALLALASLAGMAVAWWAHGRLAPRDEKALRPLRDFRFPDSLIWVLIVGIGLMLLPLDGLAERAGSNLLAFMGALYALRGAAVLLVLGGGAPGPLGALLMGVAVIVLYPIVMAATFLVGLSDTWLDIRTRRNASVGPNP